MVKRHTFSPEDGFIAIISLSLAEAPAEYPNKNRSNRRVERKRGRWEEK